MITEREKKLLAKLQKRQVWLYGKEAHDSLLIRQEVRVLFGLVIVFGVWLVTRLLGYVDTDTWVVVLNAGVVVMCLVQAIRAEILRSKIEDELQQQVIKAESGD
ncbi:hypothetical protein Rhal01_03106 [Rubritalea halochordaticola]|uniref:2TM domain-containing protein n=1 Tax=Rubritalea halochordaticola TaxID=714537 RepID=A0ABP9V2Y2_9BACT